MMFPAAPPHRVTSRNALLAAVHRENDETRDYT
jgi:hypothetical protein